MSFKQETDWKIGNAFDLAEEAWYELEELALPKLRALARSLPEPEQSELLRICRHHVGYATGLDRSACTWLGQRLVFWQVSLGSGVVPLPTG